MNHKPFYWLSNHGLWWHDKREHWVKINCKGPCSNSATFHSVKTAWNEFFKCPPGSRLTKFYYKKKKRQQIEWERT